MKISIIIPVLDEREALPAAIDSVRRAFPQGQIIAVDSGSSDGSREWLAEQKDVFLLDSLRGKGPQQNAGAEAAQGEVLLFLHADSQLPPDAKERIDAVLSSARVSGGAFHVRFAERWPASLPVLAWLMNARMHMLRRCFGDQALFVRRSVFKQAGGFPDWPLFEDYEFVRRFKKWGRFGIVSSPVTISARRFLRNGVWRTVALVMFLQAGYYLGISPWTLKQWFTDIRPHLRSIRSSRSTQAAEFPLEKLALDCYAPVSMKKEQGKDQLNEN
jgi:rSAM/selenodomain-associated transferase 2